MAARRKRSTSVQDQRSPSIRGAFGRVTGWKDQNSRASSMSISRSRDSPPAESRTETMVIEGSGPSGQGAPMATQRSRSRIWSSSSLPLGGMAKVRSS